MCLGFIDPEPAKIDDVKRLKTNSTKQRATRTNNRAVNLYLNGSIKESQRKAKES